MDLDTVKMQVIDKIKKSCMSRMVSMTRCNWPELSNYCGCCSLSTGIYIRCIFTVVITTVTVIFNGILLDILIKTRCRLHHADLTVLEEYLEEDDDINGFVLLFDGVVIYYILFISFKILYIIRNIWLLVAVFTKNRRSLQILLYVGIPCWVFDGFLSVVGTVILRNIIKLVLLINFLFEGYNLLAVNSKYKRISGKSRIVREVDYAEPAESICSNGITTPQSSNLIYPQPNLPHCPTCACFTWRNDNTPCELPTSADVVPTTSAQLEENNASDYEKNPEVLNFKDRPIIYNQEQLLQAGGSSIVPTGQQNTPYLRRPTTLALKPIEETEMKQDLCDTPVIYDQCQLNTGRSPILEDR